MGCCLHHILRQRWRPATSRPKKHPDTAGQGKRDEAGSQADSGPIYKDENADPGRLLKAVERPLEDRSKNRATTFFLPDSASMADPFPRFRRRIRSVPLRGDGID